MVRFQFINRSDERVVEKLRGRLVPAELAIVNKVDELDARLQRRVQMKLEGEVLKSHTHKLSNSVRMVPARKVGSTIAGFVQAGGGVAPYGIYQERGAHIPEVTGKLMVFPGAERTAVMEVLGKTTARKIYGRSGGMVFTMRHRAFDLPARPFMATSLEEMKAEFIREIGGAIGASLK